LAKLGLRILGGLESGEGFIVVSLFQVRNVLSDTPNQIGAFLFVVEARLISGAETGICVGEDMSRLVHLQVYHGCYAHAAGVGLQHVEAKPNSISSSYLTDAPFSISNSTVTELPLSEAKCNGVLLSIVRALTDAPFSISNETVFKPPPIDAKCHGVSLSVLRASRVAPFSISKATVSKSPRSDAQCNGV
jgi:hypothetical protein